MLLLPGLFAIELKQISKLGPNQFQLVLTRNASWKEWEGSLILSEKGSTQKPRRIALVSYDEANFAKGAAWKLEYYDDHYGFDCFIGFATSRALCEFLMEKHDGRCVKYEKVEGTATTPWKETFMLKVGPFKDIVPIVIRQRLDTRKRSLE